MIKSSIPTPISRWPQNSIRKAITRVELLAILVVLALAGMVGYRFLPGMGKDRIEAQRAVCLENLRVIGQGIQSYLDSSENRWPYVAKLTSMEIHQPAWPTLPTVLKPFVTNSEIFHCPADRRELSADSPLLKNYPRETTWFATEGLSYEWSWSDAYGGKKVGEESLAKAKGFGMGRSDQRLLTDFEPFHKGDGKGSLNTLNADLRPRTSRDKN